MVKIYKFCECALIDKQISSFVDTKKSQKLQDSTMNLKHTKSNGACSLLCTLIDTTPFRFWHTNTQRKNEIYLQTTNKE
jgi:hypothetical protein